MADVKQIPTPELICDLGETIVDIALCQDALTKNVYVCMGKSVLACLQDNLRIREIIEIELDARHMGVQ